MADVSRDRAQLMVVGAIALAVALVAVGLVLNFSIYTENLATREGNSGASSVVHEQQAAVDGVGRAIEYVNTHYAAASDHNKTEINETLQQHVADLNGSLAKIGAVSGGSVQVTHVRPYLGVRLADQNQSRAYLSKSDAENWKLVDDANEVGRFTMRLDRSSLTDVNGLSLSLDLNTGIYHVNVTDANNNKWTTYVYRDSSTGYAYLVTDSGNVLDELGDILYTCKSTKENLTIDFTEGTFGGTDCPELRYFANDVAQPYDVKFGEGDDATGTYEILLNSTSSHVSSNFNDPSVDESPYAHNATFTADVTFQYIGNDVRYRDQRTISPILNITEFPGLAPEVLEFAPTDDQATTSDGVTTDVSWHVRDRDGDLTNVRVELVDGNNNEKTITEQSYGGVKEASATWTLDDTDDGGGDYSVQIFATDGNGNVVVRTVNVNDQE